MEAVRISFAFPPHVDHLESRVATGEADLLLCRAVLNRSLTEPERAWFDTAESWREPAPNLFLLCAGAVHFMCPLEEKSQWLMTLEHYLEEAWQEA